MKLRNLSIGVGQYRSDSVPDLTGPPKDVGRISDLLTGKNGYGFPKENVCLLLDDQVTRQQFLQAFEDHLIKPARKSDVVVFYYAGHGSQTKDLNGEQPDGMDETFVLNDSRVLVNGKKSSDFIDDEFNALLGRLYQKTHNVSLIIDSCNSGTATRGDAQTMAARQIPSLVSAHSYQVPYFQANLDRPVFGNITRRQPAAWEVIDAGPPIRLGGAPLPGLGKGAELRIYDGSVLGSMTRDPAKAKETVVISELTGLNVTATMSAQRAGAAPLAAGDLAIPVRPADEFVRLKVRLKPGREAGGIPASRSTALHQAISGSADIAGLVELTEGPANFELSLNGEGKLQLRGPENRVRDTYARDNDAVTNLWQYARQRGLLQLQGEGAAIFAITKPCRCN